MISNITFEDPQFLFMLVVIPLMGVWYWYKYTRGYPEIQISSTRAFENTPKSARLYSYHLLFALRLLAVSLLIVAMARPQSRTKRQNVSIEGIDIITALDVSGSMLAQDLKPNRLEAAKNVALDFFKGRQDDRIGLGIFSEETFTQCPLTTDHSIIEDLCKDSRGGMSEEGAAIGDGLATAVNRLRESEAISKVIILLTDGVNNAGSLDPVSAAEIAKLYRIRIYTIGVGTHGMAPYPVQTPYGVRMQDMEVQIDEELLQQVAEMTDGRYFRATSNKKLKEIYREIDQLERSKIDITEFKKMTEEFHLLVLLALGMFILEVILRHTVFRTAP